jgi:hypothetical protein
LEKIESTMNHIFHTLFHVIIIPAVIFLNAVGKIHGDEIPPVINTVMEKRRIEAVREVERDFEEVVQNDTMGFEKLILAINRGVFAKGKNSVTDIEKMLSRKLKLFPNYDSKNIRFIAWNVRYEDYVDFDERHEKVMKSATWNVFFEFDEEQLLIRYWLE